MVVGIGLVYFPFFLLDKISLYKSNTSSPFYKKYETIFEDFASDTFLQSHFIAL